MVVMYVCMIFGDIICHVVSTIVPVYVELVILYPIMDPVVAHTKCLWYSLLCSILCDTFHQVIVDNDVSWWSWVFNLDNGLSKRRHSIGIKEECSQFGLYRWWEHIFIIAERTWMALYVGYRGTEWEGFACFLGQEIRRSITCIIIYMYIWEIWCLTMDVNY